ncbi:MAG: redoxin domain-containing protein [Halioglobus sp.]
MKKVLVAAAVALATATALVYMYRVDVKEAAFEKLTENMFVPADTDSFDPGPALGSNFPGVRAVYQGREISVLSEFAGPNGIAFVASRSLEWCPYCMKQMVQLQAYKQDFDAAGIALVGITYDKPELQQQFIDKFGITIPILSDVDALTFKTLGLLNTDYVPGDRQYGIPHPGMIVINPQGQIVGKLFLEAYSARVDSAAALAFASQALGLEEQ